MSTVKHTIEPHRHLNPPTPYPPQKVSGFTRFRKVTLKSSGGVRTPGPPPPPASYGPDADDGAGVYK